MNKTQLIQMMRNTRNNLNFEGKPEADKVIIELAREIDAEVSKLPREKCKLRDDYFASVCESSPICLSLTLSEVASITEDSGEYVIAREVLENVPSLESHSLLKRGGFDRKTQRRIVSTLYQKIKTLGVVMNAAS